MKRFFVFLCTTTVLLLCFSSSYAALITGLTKTGGCTFCASPEIVVGGLVPSALSYVDRTAIWEDIPTYLLGSDYIKTVNYDKDWAGEQYSVEIGSAALLHVFVDQRLGAPSAANELTWLEDNSVVAGGFAKTSAIILQSWTTWEKYDFDVWTAAVTSGTYNLGEQSEGSFYGIAASPNHVPEPTTIMLLGAGLLGLGLVGRRKFFKQG